MRPNLEKALVGEMAMTPIEVMAKAAWDPLFFWGTWENAGDDVKACLIAAMRAALLALADEFEDPVVKKAILAAADEGKTKAEIAKPILDGMVARGELLEPK